jgi:hypothetical protein
VRATAPALAGYVLGEEHALAGSLEC